MLKVVGASWEKTRIGTCILLVAGLLFIGAFFIRYIERPEYDGTYCATAFYTKKLGIEIEYWKLQNDLVNITPGVARVCYKDSIYENGWAQIEIETQRNYPDAVQAFAAGFLEGSLTWSNIYSHWMNTIGSSCERDDSSQQFCTWLRALILNNFERMRDNVSRHGARDLYWHQIGLFLDQLEGMTHGYRSGAKRARSDFEDEIPFSDFLLMNAAADIQDLKIYYENYVLSASSTNAAMGDDEQGQKNFFLPSATMLTKIFQTNDSAAWQLLFGHSTAGSYSSMLRIQKRYKFHYHFGPDSRSKTVPGVDITFAGYPGILGSTDDFYIVKGRHLQAIVAGVAIKNNNLKLWKTVDVQQAIPLTARVMAANRISQNRRSWSKAMTRYAVTGSKQWITVDMSKLSPTDKLFETLAKDDKHDDTAHQLNAADEAAILERQNRYKDMVWIVEQLPARMHIKDVTQQFLFARNSTWVANGVPYFDEMLEASSVSRDNYSFDITPADNAELSNLEAVDKYLRTHGFRGDLLADDESVAFGNIDVKLFSYNARIGSSDYHAFAGPVYLRVQHTQLHDLLQQDAALVKTNEPVEGVAAAIKDDRLTVSIDDAAELAELEIMTEKRAVRNDMRAIAMRQMASGPFRWSSVANKMSGAEHIGQPDEWNFDKVSPKWAW